MSQVFGINTDEAIAMFNETLPIMIDEFTRMDKFEVEHDNNRGMYYYTIIDEDLKDNPLGPSFMKSVVSNLYLSSI